MSTKLSLGICDEKWFLSEHLVKDRTDGRTWFCFTRPNGKPNVRFGEAIPALDTELPELIEIDGELIELTKGLTGYDHTGKEVDDDHRPKVSFSGAVLLPTFKEERKVQVSISETKITGLWNIRISVTRIASESPEEKAARLLKTAAKSAESKRKTADETLKMLRAMYAMS